jgi:hypothetical protein
VRRGLWIAISGLAIFGMVVPPVQAAPRSDGPLAATVLASLPVKGRAPMTGYDRAQFGPSWADVDRNGCDTRNDVLGRDLVERRMEGDCLVLAGILFPDPYTGRGLNYVRGRSVVDIDHVVALGNAWATGAQQLSAGTRTALANDPLNLLAVSASANRQKGDGDAATWLPSNKAYRCSYVARQLAVKRKYGLWVTAPERDAIRRILAACPDQRVPVDGSLPDPAPSSGARPSSSPSPSAPSSSVARYANCTAARAAGVTPIRRNENPALYAANRHMDRDGDGVACE